MQTVIACSNKKNNSCDKADQSRIIVFSNLSLGGYTAKSAVKQEGIYRLVLRLFSIVGLNLAPLTALINGLFRNIFFQI